MERRITKTEMMATIRACWLDSGYSNRSQTRLLREMDMRFILYHKECAQILMITITNTEI